MDDDFWAPRTSLRTPIPEIEAAADLIALAADSLLAGDETQARSYIDQANMPTLRAYTRSIASQVTLDIHRYRDVPGLAVSVPMSDRPARKPSKTVELDVYRRDGFRCRYCGCRIVFPQAETIIAKLVPEAVRWGTKDSELNAAFYTLKGVLDHLDPHAHGGSSEPENLVVSCQPCNYGKGNWLIQQLGLSDPRLRSPQTDAWDGLRRVLPLRSAKLKSRTKAVQQGNTAMQSKRSRLQSPPPKPSISINDFASEWSAGDRRHLDALLRMLDACADIGVDWRLNRVLLANIKVNGVTINALGVEQDATVQVPWFIGPHKRAFRPFVEILAAAMPDATVYETEKMWRVRCSGRLPRLSELVQDQEAVRTAFKALKHALTQSPVELSSHLIYLTT